ncbi:hypothetical protein [Aquimonas sp.]|jgi:hypothetical protein|uniref:hypothetical protein n=1 Tax=Aquimonas sp. TaxID=1872588 RepID=UPI0037C18519
MSYPEVLSVDVQNMRGREWQPGDPIREIPRQHWADPLVLNAQQREPVNAPAADPLVALQQQFDRTAGLRGTSFSTPQQSYQGSPGTTLPPDPTGDIGTTQYVQAINGSGGSRIRVYNKLSGAIQADFTLASTLTGTSPCNTGLGDPIVLFDALANRWVITEFSPQAGRALCVYVSANDDAANTSAGNWSRYSFVMPAFPDYPKYGVWPDAYYVTANEGGTAGARPVYTFERQQMLQGLPARFVRVTVPNLSGFGFQLLTPAHFVGVNQPPAGAPGVFMRHRDDESHNTGSNNPAQDFLELWQFSMDWAPATPVGTLTPVHQIPIAEFNSRINGLTAFNAFPQPNGQRLDPLREPIMNVLMYRNFGSHESLVGNLTTNTQTDPVLRGAIRWFELRRATGTAATGWQLHQEGTYAPTDDGGAIDRWMGGSGIDDAGNIALAYSVVRQAGTTPIPAGLRYVGRLAGDPLGVMSTAEGVIATGERSQGNERWGDYHQMGVDPVDGCTFWFTGEYMGPAGSTNNTRIASFRHQACGTPTFTLASSVSQQAVCTANAPVTLNPIAINVGSVNSFVEPVSLSFDPALPAGITGNLSPATVVPGNGSSLALSLAANTAIGANTVTVLGETGNISKSINILLNVSTALPTAPALVSPANAATNVLLRPTLSWAAATQGSAYVVEVATDAGFSNIVFTGNVTNGTSVSVGTALQSSTNYFWRARSSNVCGAGGNSPVFSFRTQPAPGDCDSGSTAFNVYSENFTAGAAGYTTTGSVGAQTWALSTVKPSPLSGGNAFLATGIATVSDQRLTSPTIELPSDTLPLTLKFQNFRNLENNATTGCYDGGILEISVDGGAFTQITGSALLNDPYRGPISGQFGNVLGGVQAWCEPNPGRPYADTLVDLSPYAGSDVQLRWRVGTDDSAAREGWYVDDVRVQACNVPTEPDLAVGMTSASPQVGPGQSFTLVAQASNGTSIAATNVVLDVSVDPAFQITAVTGAGWTCAPATATTHSCTLATLAGGAAAPVQISLTVAAGATAGAKTSSVAITGVGGDANPANNAAQITTTLVIPNEVFANGFEQP